MSIKPGDNIFFMDNGLLSRTIRLVSTGKKGVETASHMATVHSIDLEGVWIVEAAWPTTRKINLKRYRKSKMWVRNFNDPEAFRLALKWAATQNMPYDPMHIVGIFLRGFTRLLGPKIYARNRRMRILLSSKIRFICSEFCAYILKMAGYPLPACAHITQLTPNDIKKTEIYKIKVKELLWASLAVRYYSESPV